MFTSIPRSVGRRAVTGKGLRPGISSVWRPASGPLLRACGGPSRWQFGLHIFPHNEKNVAVFRAHKCGQAAHVAQLMVQICGNEHFVKKASDSKPPTDWAGIRQRPGHTLQAPTACKQELTLVNERFNNNIYQLVYIEQ